MIIDAVSDLHYELGSHAAIEELAKQLINEKPEVFILAGDIAGREINDFYKCLDLFKPYSGLKIATLGNHDVWTIKPGEDSFDKAKQVISVLKNYGFNVLDEKPAVTCSGGKKTAFVGNMGWYDYSFFKPELVSDKIILNNPKGERLEDLDDNYFAQKYILFADKKLKSNRGGITWNDKFNVKWGKSDQEMTDGLAAKLEKDLQSVYGAVDNIVVVMHHQPFDSMVVRNPSVPGWEFSNAYMGSKKFGEVIKKYNIDGKIKKVMAGHSHTNREIKEGNLDCLAVAFNHRQPKLHRIEL